jgi:class 3 adenylate cyclase
VAILLADLSSFSAYVRDTRDDELIRNSLTSFYSKSRYQVLNNGGMLYQFVGDEVVALFGIPDRQPGFVQEALEAAKSLLNIGTSISNRWQRHIDRVQAFRGAHVGMAIGDLQIVSLRPFSRTRMGAIGDAINVAARLMAVAGPNEIVVSNALYNELDEEAQGAFEETEPVEARNIGRIKAWRSSWHQS